MKNDKRLRIDEHDIEEELQSMASKIDQLQSVVTRIEEMSNRIVSELDQRKGQKNDSDTLRNRRDFSVILLSIVCCCFAIVFYNLIRGG